MRGDVDGEIISGYPLPDFLKELIPQVAEELRLYPNWLNASTALLMIDLSRFPDDFLSEVVQKDYREYLRVTFIGRHGQIYLKMYAAADRDEQRDIDDLLAMNLTPLEAERSARWLLEAEVIDRARKDEVFEVLRKIGHDEVIQRIG